MRRFKACGHYNAGVKCPRCRLADHLDEKASTISGEDSPEAKSLARTLKEQAESLRKPTRAANTKFRTKTINSV